MRYAAARRWNGVAILARWAPIVTRRDLPGDASDGQCRYLEVAVNGVLVASIYAPNGKPQPAPKFDYKLAWLKRLSAHAAELYATGAPVVLAGDFNVVPTDLDIYPTKSWDRDALLQPESRAAYQRLLSQGWTDAIRALHPKEPMYTFWDYMRKRWEAANVSRFMRKACPFATSSCSRGPCFGPPASRQHRLPKEVPDLVDSGRRPLDHEGEPRPHRRRQPDAGCFLSPVSFLKPAAQSATSCWRAFERRLGYNRNHDPHYRPLGLPISVEG